MSNTTKSELLESCLQESASKDSNDSIMTEQGNIEHKRNLSNLKNFINCDTGAEMNNYEAAETLNKEPNLDKGSDHLSTKIIVKKVDQNIDGNSSSLSNMTKPTLLDSCIQESCNLDYLLSNVIEQDEITYLSNLTKRTLLDSCLQESKDTELAPNIEEIIKNEINNQDDKVGDRDSNIIEETMKLNDSSKRISNKNSELPFTKIVAKEFGFKFV